MIDLSISIATTNHRELLQNCLSSIYANTRRVSFEIFVVDSGSVDDTLVVLANQFPKVRLIQNARFPGYAAANNQALRQCSGRYAMILNDDTIVKDRALDKMVAFLDAHPKVGAVGPYLLNPDGSHQISSYLDYPSFKTQFWTTAYPFTRLWARRKRSLPAGSDFFDCYGTYNGDPGSPRQVKHLMGACIVVRREVLQSVGLLDEKMYLSFEDQDWCKRIDMAGWQVYYFPESKLIHLGSQSAVHVNGLQGIVMDSRLYSQLKHSGPLSAALLGLFTAAIALHNLALYGVMYFVVQKNHQRRQNYRSELVNQVNTLRWAWHCRLGRREAGS